MGIGHNLRDLVTPLYKFIARLTWVNSMRACIRLAESSPVFPPPGPPGETMYGKFSRAAASPVCDICEYPRKHNVGPRDQKASPVLRRIRASAGGPLRGVEWTHLSYDRTDNTRSKLLLLFPLLVSDLLSPVPIGQLNRSAREQD